MARTKKRRSRSLGSMIVTNESRMLHNFIDSARANSKAGECMTAVNMLFAAQTTVGVIFANLRRVSSEKTAWEQHDRYSRMIDLEFKKLVDTGCLCKR